MEMHEKTEELGVGIMRKSWATRVAIVQTNKTTENPNPSESRDDDYN